jgi:hypothetical protein
MSPSAVQTVNQGSRPRHAATLQDLSNFSSSRPVQDDDLSSQESFSLSRGSHEFDQWALTKSESLASSPLSLTKSEPSEVQMLPYSYSQQYLSTTAGPCNIADSMFSLCSGDQNEMDLSPQHDFQSLVDLSPFDNDASLSDVNQQCYTDDDMSVGYGSHNDDSQMIAANGSWGPLNLDGGNYHGQSLDQLPGIFPAPVSPPLTEASNASVPSACSQSGYHSFRGHEENALRDNANATIGGQNISLADQFLPMTPPLSDQDPNRFAFCPRFPQTTNADRYEPMNRTIRPSKPAQRPLLSTVASRSSRKSDPEFYNSLAVKDPLRQRSKEGSEVRPPRDHPYYSLSTRNDGKYYCPFASGEKPCNHPATTQKCAYQ